MIGKGVWPVSTWPGGSQRWLCVCMKCGEFVTPRYNNVMQPGRGGCEPCGRLSSAANRRLPAEASVAEMRTAGVEPIEPYPGIDAPWRCRCLSPLCPGLWMGDPADIRPRLADVRRSVASACKFCARVAIRPERATYEMIERGVEPIVPYPGAAAAWHCRCLTCNSTDISPSYANVVLTGQGGCEHCGGRKRVPEQQAVREMLEVGAEPLAAYPGANERWRSRCLALDCPGPADRIIYPRLGWIRRGAQACKWCAGVAIDVRVAHDTMVAVGLAPLEPYPGVRTPWACRCLNPACQAVVRPTLGSVRSRDTRCAACAVYGFKPDKPALVYFLTHPRLNAAKIGICNLATGRIERHQRRGWRRYETLEFHHGNGAAQLEREVIAEWRAQRWDPVLDEGETYDGWTETVALTDELTPDVLWKSVLELKIVISPNLS
ncbi:hypothetical protein EDD29_0409 [Actinocorallia herbida]|uniref:Uncharacterized protein n=1 Tax=Actinocorallia herbida TaxID=58109 RepID=A0A3N1CP31_9ACTN|nr:hypothetical protein EDD29_0409 [Actinocorallia herbida]